MSYQPVFPGVPAIADVFELRILEGAPQVVTPLTFGELAAARAVMVLVGAAASGKTTVRRQLLAHGYPPELVISLDDERELLRRATIDQGREPKPLQDYSLPALRRAASRQEELARSGLGYLFDATSLRRRERREHAALAARHGLPAYALLLPAVPLEVLVARNATRTEDRQVPLDVLARQAHRHSLLDPVAMLDEGFTAVHVVRPVTP